MDLVGKAKRVRIYVTGLDRALVVDGNGACWASSPTPSCSTG